MKNKRDLKLIEFIEKNENWKELIQQKPYSIAVKEEDGFILLKYNQLESDFSNEVVREAGRNGFHASGVFTVCRGEKHTHHGFVWKYLEA